MNGDRRLEDALREHVQVLSVDIGDRSTSRPKALERAREYLRGRLEEAGLTVHQQEYDFFGLEVANLIAQSPSAPAGGPYYVVGAHYDTVSGTPGADDNASALAVLLELARAVAAREPPVPLRLVAFTLEEPPAFGTRLQGSRVFVRRLREAGERVLGAVILEMVGFTSPVQPYPLALRWAGYPKQGDFIAIIGNRGSRAFGQAVLAGFRRNPDLPVESLFVPANGWVLPMTRLSDHASFWDRGLPAVMITDTAFMRNPNYHTQEDRMETLDFTFMARLVRSLERALEALAEVS